MSELKICLKCNSVGVITIAEYMVYTKPTFGDVGMRSYLCLKHLAEKKDEIINDAKIIKDGAVFRRNVITGNYKIES